MEKIRNEPTFKGAFGRSLFKTLYDHQISPNNTRNKILKETFLTVPIVIYTKKEFYLLDELNKKIELLKSSGLIDYWHNQEVNKGALTEHNLGGPRILRIGELLGCFQILLSGCLIGLVIFVLEFFISIIMDESPKLVDSI